jgi:hypothetical protein
MSDERIALVALIVQAAWIYTGLPLLTFRSHMNS